MREVSPDLTNTHGTLSSKSDRRVEVKASCAYFPVIRGQKGDESSITYLNGTTEHSLFNISSFGPGTTVWVNPRSDLEKNKNWDCGVRCAAIAAIQYIDPNVDSDARGAFYDCEVTVSEVYGATLLEHTLPDMTADIAGGAIALAGYSKGPDQWEYMLYPPESKWSNYNYDTEDDNSEAMADLAAQYAVGAIAARDLMGPQTLQVTGMVAWIGVLLKVKWGYLVPIHSQHLIRQVNLIK